MRHAPEPAEGHDERDDADNEEKRFAGDRQQDSNAQHGSHQQINQNRQSKLHGYIVVISGLIARASVKRNRVVSVIP